MPTTSPLRASAFLSVLIRDGKNDLMLKMAFHDASLDGFKEFVARHAQCTLITVADAGQLVVFCEAGLTLDYFEAVFQDASQALQT